MMALEANSAGWWRAAGSTVNPIPSDVTNALPVEKRLAVRSAHVSAPVAPGCLLRPRAHGVRLGAVVVSAVGLGDGGGAAGGSGRSRCPAPSLPVLAVTPTAVCAGVSPGRVLRLPYPAPSRLDAAAQRLGCLVRAAGGPTGSDAARFTAHDVRLARRGHSPPCRPPAIVRRTIRCRRPSQSASASGAGAPGPRPVTRRAATAQSAATSAGYVLENLLLGILASFTQNCSAFTVQNTAQPSSGAEALTVMNSWAGGLARSPAGTPLCRGAFMSRSLPVAFPGEHSGGVSARFASHNRPRGSVNQAARG